MFVIWSKHKKTIKRHISHISHLSTYKLTKNHVNSSIMIKSTKIKMNICVIKLHTYGVINISFFKTIFSRPALHQNSASTSGLTLLDYKAQIKEHNSLNNMSYFTKKISFASLIHVSYSPEFIRFSRTSHQKVQI